MIEKLRKMLAEATPRTWRTAKITADGPHHNEPAGVCPPYLWAVVCDPAPNSVEQAGANAALIAAAVNTLPALLDAADSLAEILAYRGGADSPLADEYVMDRARRALAALAKEGT